MPQFRKPLTADGPVVDLRVGLSSSAADYLRKGGRPVPPPVLVQAVIDTGSHITCIDVRALRSLAAVPTGSRSVLTPSTGSVAYFCDLYEVTLAVVDGQATPPLSLDFGTVTITDMDLLSTGIPAPLGRDLLDLCAFHYDGPGGVFTLSG